MPIPNDPPIIQGGKVVLPAYTTGLPPGFTFESIRQQNDKESVEAAEVLLRAVAGLDVHDVHGQGTPERFVQMLRELTTSEPVRFTTFPNDGYDEMIVIQRIPFVSLCSHHIIPFMGTAAVGYVPDQKIAGLSKFARVIHHYAKRLQVQERLTQQIADFLQKELEPKGIAVVMEAEHLCMTIRGAQAPGATTYTAVMQGVFGDHSKTAKMEFLARVREGQ